MTTTVPFNVPLLPLQVQEVLARARQYRNVAISLVDIDNGRPNWAQIHASISRYRIGAEGRHCSVRRAWRGEAFRSGARQPRFEALYDYATAYGLIRRQEVLDELPHISELHVLHYARYPQAPVRPVALISQFDDLADQILHDAADAVRVV
jgi:hypothetical protein